MIGGLGSLTGGVLGAIYIEGSFFLLPADWRLFSSALGVLFVLLVIPGGLGRCSSGSATSSCAGSRGAASLIVPSLLADRRVEEDERPEPEDVEEELVELVSEELRVSWVRRRLEEVTGGGPVYPLLILFGLNAVDELDRTAFGILLPEIRDALRARQPGILSIVGLIGGVSLVLQIPIAHYADRGPRVRLALLGAVGVVAVLVRHRPGLHAVVPRRRPLRLVASARRWSTPPTTR